MSFLKYPEYKESGVEWLGAVPNHWIVRKVSVDFSATKGPRGALLTKEYCHENSGEYPVYSGQTENGGVLGEIADFDFDLGRDGAILSTTVGAKAMSVSHIVGRVSLSQNCMIIKSTKRDINIKFFFYHFQPLFLLERRMIPDHMQPSFRMEDLYSFRIAVPPESEQIHIARFLDHETARIDALIEEQQRLIELLKEKRQAIISHAITNGLDPAVPMKDSGVEWLGEVPAHWTIKLSRHLFEFVTSGSRGWAEFYADEGKFFFRITNLTRDSIEPKLESIQYVNPPENSEGVRAKVRLGDILISITADLGSVCVANEEISDSYVSQHVALARPFHGSAFSRWIGYCVLSTPTKEQLVGAGYGGTKVQLSLEDIKSFLVANPPYSEQVAIAEFLDGKIKNFDLLIHQALAGVSLLAERRSAMISAAVTGKIDVRGWQSPAGAPSPELAQEAV